MDELAVAYVDAHVADGLAAAGEEDGIAGLQVFVGDRHAVFVYVGGGAVGLIAEALVDVAHKAGAVKAGGGRRTRPDVGVAHILLGEVHDLLPYLAAARRGSGGGGGAGALAQLDVVAAYVTGHAAGVYAVPVARDAGDLHALAVAGHAEYLAVRAGGGAHAHARAVHPAGGGDVHRVGYAEVVGGHIAPGAVDVHAVPAVGGLALDYHRRPGRGGEDYRIVRARAGAQVDFSGGRRAANAVGGGRGREGAAADGRCGYAAEYLSLGHLRSLSFIPGLSLS